MPQQQSVGQNYVFGSSVEEQARLKLQAEIVAAWSRRYLAAAGLESGMRVLDLGTGMGDLAFLAAAVVGPTGLVTGLDKDAAFLERARMRAAAREDWSRVQFVQGEFAQFETRAKFDAVIGRYFLIYQPDAAQAVRRAAALVERGGIVCFHEMAFGNGMESAADSALFRRLRVLVADVFRRLGLNPDMGLGLARAFVDAGLPRPSIAADVPVGGEPGSYLYGWAADTVKALLPRMEQFGLATAEELLVETLAQRIEQEALRQPIQMLGPLQFGAWSRTP
jgi:ubiquinone/menaquinone biosynthesis C-methylase UbiE